MRFFLLFFLSWPIYGAVTHGGVSMVLDEVSSQLITLSDSEEKNMAAASGQAVYTKEKETAINIARAWTENVLNPIFRPPKESELIPFDGDGKQQCDIIRARYSVLQSKVMMAQSFCLFAIVIDHSFSTDKPLLNQVTDLAKKVFLEPQRIVLKMSHQGGSESSGEQQAIEDESISPDFIDHLKFWTDGKKVLFVTLKVTRHPSRAVMAWPKGFNISWFNLYK
jgi:hypothetical protein